MFQHPCSVARYLSVVLSLCLSVVLSPFLVVFLCFCLSVFLPLCLSGSLAFGRLVSVLLRMFVSLSVCLSAILSVCLSVCLCACASVFLSLFVSLSLCLPFSLSLGQCVGSCIVFVFVACWLLYCVRVCGCGRLWQLSWLRFLVGSACCSLTARVLGAAQGNAIRIESPCRSTGQHVHL